MADSIKRRVTEKLTLQGREEDKKPNSKHRKCVMRHASDKVALHRGGNQKSNRLLYTNKNKRRKHKKGTLDMNDIERAIKFIIENHGSKIDNVISKVDDPELVSGIAKRLMQTCLSGWSLKEDKSFLVSNNTDLKLSTDSWTINESGTINLKNGFAFDFDWLYEFSNACKTLAEGINIKDEDEMDKDSFADMLGNAANVVRKLNDKEVKKYILSAAKQDENIDTINLKNVLEETGINWKFVGADVDEDAVNVFIRVKYSSDGTQDGVVEKKLSIRVKPSADVKEETTGGSGEDKIDLDFGAEESGAIEPEIKPEEPELPELETPGETL